MATNEAADEVAQAVNQLAASLGVAPEHVRVIVEHPIFGTQEISAREGEGASAKKAAAAEPEPEPEPETPESPKTADSEPEKTDEQKASLAKIAKAKAGGDAEKAGEGLSCPDCGKPGFASQNAVNGHLANCPAKADEGESAESAKADEDEPAEIEGEWANLTDEEKANLRASKDEKAVNALCDSAADHISAKGRCCAKRANDERCEYGRKGFDTIFCIRHSHADNPAIHPDALAE